MFHHPIPLFYSEQIVPKTILRHINPQTTTAQIQQVPHTTKLTYTQIPLPPQQPPSTDDLLLLHTPLNTRPVIQNSPHQSLPKIHVMRNFNSVWIMKLMSLPRRWFLMLALTLLRVELEVVLLIMNRGMYCNCHWGWELWLDILLRWMRVMISLSRSLFIPNEQHSNINTPSSKLRWRTPPDSGSSGMNFTLPSRV